MANGTLNRGSIGFWGVVFISMVAIFPANIYIISSTTALTYAGEAAPLTFIIGTALMFLNVIIGLLDNNIIYGNRIYVLYEPFLF